MDMQDQKGPETERSLKETFRTGTPEEVREKVKRTVEKGVAAIAGALKGFSEETQRNRMPETARSAVRDAAEATRSTVAGVTEEAERLKEPIQQAGRRLGETARDVGRTMRSEARQTRDAVRHEEGGGTLKRERSALDDL